MSAAFAFRGEKVWSSSGVIERLLERAEAVAVSRFPHGHAVPRFFGERRRSFFAGAVVDLGEELGEQDRRGAAEVLQSVADEELRREDMGRPGLLWLRRDFARFLKTLRGEDPGPRPAEWDAEYEAAGRAEAAPYENAPAAPRTPPAAARPWLLPAFGAASLGLALLLQLSGAEPRSPLAVALAGLGALALSRALWRRWGL